jgi:ABC-type transport system involved in multi-copper enzyme maturation permease subunit
MIRVELRKAVDTRAGFWLQVAVGLLTLAAVVLYVAFAKGKDDNFEQFVSLALAPASILLPVVGILLVSSEWSQRTALVTFTLVPRRASVFWAKLGAGLTLGAAAFVVCLLAGALGNAASGGEWLMPAGMYGQMLLSTLVAMATGIGFGAALLSSAPAIVASFALPLAWTALGTIPFLHGPARWLDQSRALAPLTDHVMSATEWAHAGTALALWMVVPLAIGYWRFTRGEV